jgi:hypothetical protein
VIEEMIDEVKEEEKEVVIEEMTEEVVAIIPVFHFLFVMSADV